MNAEEVWEWFRVDWSCMRISENAWNIHMYAHISHVRDVLKSSKKLLLITRQDGWSNHRESLKSCIAVQAFTDKLYGKGKQGTFEYLSRNWLAEDFCPLCPFFCDISMLNDSLECFELSAMTHEDSFSPFSLIMHMVEWATNPWVSFPYFFPRLHPVVPISLSVVDLATGVEKRDKKLW